MQEAQSTLIHNFLLKYTAHTNINNVELSAGKNGTPYDKRVGLTEIPLYQSDASLTENTYVDMDTNTNPKPNPNPNLNPNPIYSLDNIVFTLKKHAGASNYPNIRALQTIQLQTLISNCQMKS